MIKIIPATDFEKAHELRDYCFTPYKGKRRDDFSYWLANSITLGAYEEDVLAGLIMSLPLNMTINRVSYKMGGVGFVSTYPEYRNRGIMKQLIQELLRKMRANGETVSVLAPYSVSFYRYFGWELFVDRVDYTIPQALFPDFGKQADDVRRFRFANLNASIFDEVKLYHNKEALKRTGMVQRDDAWWLRLARREAESFFGVVYEAGSVTGYVRYLLDGLTFKVLDFYGSSPQSEQALWRFISSHSASVTEIKGSAIVSDGIGADFNNPQFKKELIQHEMVRVVDVVPFLEQYNWQPQTPLYLKIVDKFAPWNEGVYQIATDGQVTLITEVAVEKSYLHLNITTFSALMLGHVAMTKIGRYLLSPLVEADRLAWQAALPEIDALFYEHF